MRDVVRRSVARLRPLLPERVERAALVARSVVSADTPTIVTPSATSVLVLVAHPDDEAVGFGGTLARLTDRGARVRAVYLTDGEASIGTSLPREEVAVRRRDEARAACTSLGVEDVRFLGFPDGGLMQTGTGTLAAAVAPHVPDDVDLVLTTWLEDGHADHRVAARVTAALGLDPATEIWGAEIWTPCPTNRLVDISEVVERKRAAIEHHTTALAAFDATAILGLNRYRSVHGLTGRGSAEAFVAGDAAAHRDLAARLGS